MKHLKTYESYHNYKFNIGDFVKYDIVNRIVPKFKRDKIYKVDDRYAEKNVSGRKNYINSYHLKSVDNDQKFWEYEAPLININDEELKELQIKLNQYKYNL